MAVLTGAVCGAGSAGSVVSDRDQSVSALPGVNTCPVISIMRLH